jgi:hypothetical protein
VSVLLREDVNADDNDVDDDDAGCKEETTHNRRGRRVLLYIARDALW